MRLCIMHNSGPGGALRFVEEVAAHLAAFDEVVVVTWGDQPDPVIPGVAQRWLPAPRIHLPRPLTPWGDLLRSIFGSRRAAAAIDRELFDAVILFACQWGQAPQALRILRTPTLYYAQEGRRRSLERGYRPAQVQRSGVARIAWAIGTSLYDFVGGWLDRHAMAAAREVVTNSPFTAANLAAAYGKDARVVDPGVEPSIFLNKTDHEARNVVLSVGALDPTKAQHLAIEAVSLIPESRRPALHLVCNRENPVYAASLVELAGKRRVELHILRNIPDAELAAEYRGARALLATASREPFGLTIPEASVSGTPVIAIDDGGYRSTVVPGINGVLVGPTSGDIARALDDLIEGRLTFDRNRIVQWARSRWSWTRCAEDLHAACADLMRASPTARHESSTMTA